MKISTELIKALLIDSSSVSNEDITEALKSAGVEIEGIQAVHFDEGLVIAKVLELSPHPNADKLQIAVVNSGSLEFQVVCGASNIRKGQIVALAQVGSELPDGTVIKSVAIRGVESQGMLCSGKELGINEDHSGIMEFRNFEPGTRLADLFPPSHVLDIKTAANRSDLQSAVGLAREVSAHLAVPLRDLKMLDKYSQLLSSAKGELIKKSDFPREVIRYSLTRLAIPVTGVKKSDPFIERNLLYAGISLIGPVVDTGNFAMLQSGQPMHVFDSEKVKGKVAVRFANEGEKLVALGSKVLPLSSRDLVIVDDTGPIALAGIIGGEKTAVDDKTTTILLEVATFDAATVRRSALHHGLRTEASSRFERKLPAKFVHQGLAFALEYLTTTNEASVKAFDEHIHEDVLEQQVKIGFYPRKFNEFVGFTSDRVTLKEALKRLGFKELESDDKDQVIVSTPFWRPDIETYQDIYEELIKIIGLDMVPEVMPVFQPKINFPLLNQRWLSVRKLRNLLKANGGFEVNNYPFISAELEKFDDSSVVSAPPIKNPLSKEQKLLRKGLLPSLLKNLKDNRNYPNNPVVYEIAKVFAASEDIDSGVEESLKLGIISTASDAAQAYGKVKGFLDSIIGEFSLDNVEILTTQTDERLDFTHQGSIYCRDNLLGTIGVVEESVQLYFKLAPVAYCELDIVTIFDLAGTKRYTALPKYQTAKRDITVTIGSQHTWQSVKKILSKVSGLKAEFKDEYFDLSAGDQKALSLHLEFSKSDGTLAGNEVDQREQEVLALLKKSFNAEIKR